MDYNDDRWSVVVIGQNEEHGVGRCISSIHNAMKAGGVKTYTVVFVDCASVDSTMKEAVAALVDRAIELQGDVNAAIARNVGASYSQCPYLLFVDADMVVTDSVLELKPGPDEDYCVGRIVDRHRVPTPNISTRRVRKPSRGVAVSGLFATRRSVWEAMGGMDPRFRRSQDVDFAFRLVAGGFKAAYRDVTVAEHYTIPLTDHRRILTLSSSTYPLYSKALLYRTHWRNYAMYKRLIGDDYQMILGIVCAVLTILSWSNALWIYAIVVLLKARLKPLRAGSVFLSDITALLGLLTFFPSRDKHYVFKQVYPPTR